jgi:ArsR family transcriptional regulator
MSNFTTDEHEVFKALSEPIRLRIMALLTTGELCVCDLTQVLGLPQSTVSRHMNRLKASRIVADRRDGKWIHYSFERSFLEAFPELDSLFRSLKEREPYHADLVRLQKHTLAKKC